MYYCLEIYAKTKYKNVVYNVNSDVKLYACEKCNLSQELAMVGWGVNTNCVQNDKFRLWLDNGAGFILLHQGTGKKGQNQEKSKVSLIQIKYLIVYSLFKLLLIQAWFVVL